MPALDKKYITLPWLPRIITNLNPNDGHLIDDYFYEANVMVTHF